MLSARSRGFTLLELTVVIALLGIIAVVAGIAMREPLRGYDDARARADLTDAADSALRRIGRDVRQALPNSVRVKRAGAGCPAAPCTTYVEFLQLRTAGRYRAQPDGTGAGDVLDFAAADTAFDTLGPLSTLAGQAIQANDILVVFNLNANPALTEANAYTYLQGASNCTSATPASSTCNTAKITGPDAAGALANERRISFESRRFPLASPANRFHVVSGPVTFVCDQPSPGVDASGNGTGTIDRVSGYDVQLLQPGPGYVGSPITGRLATYVTACDIQYDPATSLSSYAGLLSMRLTLTRKGESISLFTEVSVNNVP